MTRPRIEASQSAGHRAPRRDGSSSRTALLVAPLVLAALLTGFAVLTVDGAGCDQPAEFVTTAEGAFLVGGCELPTTGTLAGVSTGGRD